MEVDERVAQGKGLGHTHQGVVDGRLPVGMPLAHHVAGDAGALHARSVGAHAEVVHAVEDPSVDGLEAVAHIGQGPLDDDPHGVLQEGALHLLLDLDGFDARGRIVAGGRFGGGHVAHVGFS